MKKSIITILAFNFILTFIFPGDIPGMNAVELNKKGYELYLNENYKEAIEYFKASFNKDPYLYYPHYNYSCVVSILRSKGDNETEYNSDAAFHLLTAMRLHDRYKTKWKTDPDLLWYRENMEKIRELADLTNYDPSYNSEKLKQHMVSKEKWYILSYIGIGRVHTVLDFLDNETISEITYSHGKEKATVNYTDMRGYYMLSGNMVYLSFNPPLKISEYGEESLDTIEEIYLIYENEELHIINCINDRIEISHVIDFGSGA